LAHLAIDSEEDRFVLALRLDRNNTSIIDDHGPAWSGCGDRWG
jgi:hypothetical protein